MYYSELKENKYLRKEIVKYKSELNRCNSENDNLKRRLQIYQNDNSILAKKRKKKSWNSIKCDRTKRRRISEYGDAVLSTIQTKVKYCQRANLSLTIANKNINFEWYLAEKVTPNKANDLNIKCMCIDHTYAAPTKHQAVSDEGESGIENVDYSRIFDGNGNWQKKHTRCIINVLDTFRISHEAYHELRHAGKGHFPPLRIILKEKFEMSHAIPYLKYDKVSIFH